MSSENLENYFPNLIYPIIQENAQIQYKYLLFDNLYPPYPQSVLFIDVLTWKGTTLGWSIIIGGVSTSEPPPFIFWKKKIFYYFQLNLNVEKIVCIPILLIFQSRAIYFSYYLAKYGPICEGKKSPQQVRDKKILKYPPLPPKASSLVTVSLLLRFFYLT